MNIKIKETELSGNLNSSSESQLYEEKTKFADSLKKNKIELEISVLFLQQTLGCTNCVPNQSGIQISAGIGIKNTAQLYFSNTNLKKDPLASETQDFALSKTSYGFWKTALSSDESSDQLGIAMELGAFVENMKSKNSIHEKLIGTAIRLVGRAEKVGFEFRVGMVNQQNPAVSASIGLNIFFGKQ